MISWPAVFLSSRLCYQLAGKESQYPDLSMILSSFVLQPMHTYKGTDLIHGDALLLSCYCTQGFILQPDTLNCPTAFLSFSFDLQPKNSWVTSLLQWFFTSFLYCTQKHIASWRNSQCQSFLIPCSKYAAPDLLILICILSVILTQEVTSSTFIPRTFLITLFFCLPTSYISCKWDQQDIWGINVISPLATTILLRGRDI